MELTFIVPGKPVGKGRPRFARGKARAKSGGPAPVVTYTPAETKRHERLVRNCFLAAAGHIQPSTAIVSVLVTAVFAPPASWSAKARREAMGSPADNRYDVDNVAKLALDALNGIAYVDDHQVCILGARKIYGPVAQTVVRIAFEDAR